jgi:lambda family phage minor tail protein L
MTAPQSITQELQAVAPSAIIELFQLRLVTALHGSADIYRFHAGVNGKNDGGNVVWAGQTYTAFPVECDGFDYSGNGQLPRPKLRVANVLGTITTILLAVNAITPGNDLIGAKVIRKRTLARYLDAVNFPGSVNPYGTPDPTAEFPEEIYFIARKSVESRDVVEFELASAFDLQGVRAPKRQCIANVCSWVYRSAECGYTGTRYFNDADQVVATAALDVCGKRVSSCTKRFEVTSLVPPNFNTAGTTNELLAGQQLTAGQQLVASNGWYRLILQFDGNLVIYSKAGVVIWTTDTAGSGAVRLSLQSSDGNLVLYRADNTPVWATGVTGSGHRLLILGDGNLVVYNSANTAVWSTNTSSGSEPLYATAPSPSLPFGSFPGIGSYTL